MGEADTVTIGVERRAASAQALHRLATIRERGRALHAGRRQSRDCE